MSDWYGWGGDGLVSARSGTELSKASAPDPQALAICPYGLGDLNRSFRGNGLEVFAHREGQDSILKFGRDVVFIGISRQ